MPSAPKRSPSRPSVSPTSSGVHFLTSRRVIGRLVGSANLSPSDLVLDVGAGRGAITDPLAATGAQVLAVERDPEFVGYLDRRFADTPTVRVVQGDLRTVPLPKRHFHVVASIPFAITTALLRRMLRPAGTSFGSGDLVVEWGLAKRVTTAYPRDVEQAWWQGRYELDIARRVPSGAFSPAPAVDAAHLRIRPRPGLNPAIVRALWWAQASAYDVPNAPLRTTLRQLLGRNPARALARHGIAGDARPREVSGAQWYAVAAGIADGELRLPPLPRRAR